MKNLVIMLVLLSSTMTLAQRSDQRGPRHGGEHGKNMYKDLSAEQIANLETKKMTLLLDLSNQQQSKINAIQLEIATQKLEAHANRDNQKRRKDLTPEERYAKMEAVLDNQIATKAKIKAVLNKDQFERWENHQKARFKNKKQHMGRRS